MARGDGDRLGVVLPDGYRIQFRDGSRLFDAFSTTNTSSAGIALSEGRSLIERHHERI
jgi:hypothetical protein